MAKLCDEWQSGVGRIAGLWDEVQGNAVPQQEIRNKVKLPKVQNLRKVYLNN